MDSPGDVQQNLRREVPRRVTFEFRRPGGVFDGSDEKARCSAEAGWDKSVKLVSDALVQKFDVVGIDERSAWTGGSGSTFPK